MANDNFKDSWIVKFTPARKPLHMGDPYLLPLDPTHIPNKKSYMRWHLPPFQLERGTDSLPHLDLLPQFSFGWLLLLDHYSESAVVPLARDFHLHLNGHSLLGNQRFQSAQWFRSREATQPKGWDSSHPPQGQELVCSARHESRCPSQLPFYCSSGGQENLIWSSPTRILPALSSVVF
jgi:hypothetical protein